MKCPECSCEEEQPELEKKGMDRYYCPKCERFFYIGEILRSDMT